MLTKLIDIDDALNVAEMIIMRLADQSQWKRLSDLARRELDAIPEAENAVIPDISNIVVGTIENDNDDDAAKIRKIRKILADYSQEFEHRRADFCPIIETDESCEINIEPISYQDCANAMLMMWMDDVITDGEYNRIMDKLNAHYKNKKEVTE